MAPERERAYIEDLSKAPSSSLANGYDGEADVNRYTPGSNGRLEN